MLAGMKLTINLLLAGAHIQASPFRPVFNPSRWRGRSTVLTPYVPSGDDPPPHMRCAAERHPRGIVYAAAGATR
jgi:hypothetical protein